MKMKNLAVVLTALGGLVGFLSALAGEKVSVPSAVFAGADLKMEPCRVSAECINRVWPGKQREAWRAKDAWFVNFDVARPGTLALRLPGAFKRIRPLSRTAAAAVTNGVLYTVVTGPERFVVEAGGTEVHVFANPPFVHERTTGEIYFGPGEHDAGLISPTNGQTVCIDAGARVYGSILMQGVRDVRIIGRGVLDSSRMTRTKIEDPLLDNQLRIARGEARWDVDSSSFTAIACTNLVVSGITIVDAPFYAVLLRNECKGVMIDHVKLVGNWRYNSDGFDVCASEDVTIRHSFARTFDDCVVARGLISFGRVATLRNLLVEDCELWCDWGKNLEVWAGPQPTLIENVTYRNCKALNVTGDACDVTTWGCSEDTRFRNIVMDGIEIDLPEPITPMQFQTRDDEPWAGRTSLTVSVFRVDCRLAHDNPAWLKKTRVDYRDIRLSNVRIYGDSAFVTETYSMPDELPYYRAVNVKVEPFERVPVASLGAGQRLSPGERLIPTAQGSHVSPDGHSIEVTSKCLRLDGRPIMPLMGEMHYSRVPADEWPHFLATMKAGGVSIVSTYVFWNHHEWKRGQYDFSGNRDLSRFLAEVKKAGLWAFVRIGPWVHGEAREGGFPDWLVDEAERIAKEKGKRMKHLLRTDDAWFLGETEKFWTRLLPEVEPHFWKNGGPVIGIQLENESAGPWAYYQALKDLSVKVGYDVPMYTRTVWPPLKDAETKFGELVPVYGGYAEGFWSRELKTMPGGHRNTFLMRPLRTSADIATDQLGRQKEEDAQDAVRYPYVACELGGGMVSTYHRRLNMEPLDAFAIGVVKIGSGLNLPGFFMFASGQTPTVGGVSLAESQRSRFTNYNDLPVVSYEFQSPISEFGEPQRAYALLRELARFCAEHGEELALCDPVFTNEHETRRGRFVFHNEYVRRLNPTGECWIGIEKDGRVTRLLDGQALAAKLTYDTPMLTPGLKLVKPAGKAPAVTIGKHGVALMPDESAWEQAAEYEVAMPKQTAGQPGDRTLLRFPYDGDMARLYVDGKLVQDDFWKGIPLVYPLRRIPASARSVVFKVLPWGEGTRARVYVDRCD